MTTIIAEAGINHGGEIDIAKKMVRVAKRCGADYIKFQSFVDLDPKLKEYELSKEDHLILMKECKDHDIGFASSPFDIESVELLDSLNVDFIKIPSGEITNYPYLKAIAKTRRPIIMSTGMSHHREIEDALSVFTQESRYRRKDITLLHCNSGYPTPFEDVNLRAMSVLSGFMTKVGISDHSLGIVVPIAAVALGATVVEKHFILDNLYGIDFAVSLCPDSFSEMVQGIRNIEKAMGRNFTITLSETETRKLARKSIRASRDIKKGDKFIEENLTTGRPGDGTSPMLWYSVLGGFAQKDYKKGEII